jgi:hypothetical protein
VDTFCEYTPDVMGEDIINLFFSDGQQGTEACSKAVNLVIMVARQRPSLLDVFSHEATGWFFIVFPDDSFVQS